MALCLIPSGLSLFIMVWADSLWLLYAWAALHGLTFGSASPVMNVAWAVYFGRRHMGAIRGVVTPLGSVVGALSPVYAGWAWSTENSYDIPFAVFSAIWIVGGLLALVTAAPRPKVDEP